MLALEDNGVREIARKLKVSKSTAARYISKWVRMGYLINIAPKGSVAIFKRGPNLPEGLSHQLSQGGTVLADEKTVGTVGCGLDPQDFDPMPMIGGEPISGFIPMRIHSLGHRFYLKKDGRPKKEISWTNETNCSGVPTYILKLPINGYNLTDERRIKIVYRDGKDSQSVEIWTPEVIITNPIALQEFDEWAASRAQKVANWLSRKYGFKFGIMELCQNFHYAAAVPKEVAQAAKEIGLRTPEYWWDNSRNKGDFETDEKKFAMAITTLPYRLSNLENGVLSTLEKLVDAQNELTESHQRLLVYLQKLLGHEIIEPKDTDHGGMYV